MTAGGAVTPAARQLARGSSASLVSRGLMVAAGLATNVLLARRLDPPGFAAFALFVSVVNVSVVGTRLGLSNVAVRRIAAATATGDIAARRSVVVSTLALTAAAAAAAGALAAGPAGAALVGLVLDSPLLVGERALLGAAIVLTTVRVMLTDQLRGLGRPAAASLAGESGTGVALAVLLAAAAAAGATPLPLVLALYITSISLSAAAAAGAVLAAGGLRHGGGHGRVWDRDLLREAGPLFAVDALLVMFTQGDLWVVAAFQTPEATALYGAALRVAMILYAPQVVVEYVLAPIAARLESAGDRDGLSALLQQAATLTTAAVAAGAAVCVLLGDTVLRLVLGPFYAAGAPALAALAITFTAIAACGVPAMVLTMTGHGRRVLAAFAVAVPMALAAACAASAAGSLVGVAVAVNGVLLLATAAMTRTCRSVLGIRTWADPRLVVQAGRRWVPNMPGGRRGGGRRTWHGPPS